MAETHIFAAERRARTGTGGARADRRAGLVPAVVYGGDEAPMHVTVRYNEVLKELNKGHLLATVYELELEGAKHKVIPRDVQVDVVKDLPTHVDFQRVSESTRVPVMVPVRFKNEDDCPGLKRGGVLEAVRREVELLCPAGSIPDFIEADLAGLQINDVIHISAFTLPSNVTPTITDRNFTVATISAPSGMKMDAEDADEADEDGED